jgi:hypothetical protein
LELSGRAFELTYISEPKYNDRFAFRAHTPENASSLSESPPEKSAVGHAAGAGSVSIMPFEVTLSGEISKRGSNIQPGWPALRSLSRHMRTPLYFQVL